MGLGMGSNLGTPDGDTSRNPDVHSDSEVSHKLYWCVTHNSPTGDLIIDSGSICFLRLDQGLWTQDCVFEKQWRVLAKVLPNPSVRGRGAEGSNTARRRPDDV